MQTILIDRWVNTITIGDINNKFYFIMLMISLSTWYRGNISSRVSSNAEVFASEFLENLEEMFHRYYVYNNI